MKKLARFFALIGGLVAIGYALRDRLISLTAPREPDPPRFMPMPRPEPQLPAPTPVKPAAGRGDDLTEINGIGPVFAGRLAGQGITTFSDLAAQDPAALAEAIDVAETRVAPWIDEAKGRKAP